MDFGLYDEEMEKVFQENPVFVLEKLLENHPKVSPTDLIKLSVSLQENWSQFHKYGVNFSVTINDNKSSVKGINIKEYDFEKDIKKIKQDANIKSVNYETCTNGMLLSCKNSKEECNFNKLSYSTRFKKQIGFLLGIKGIDIIIDGTPFETEFHLSSYKDLVKWREMFSIEEYQELLQKFFNDYVQYDVQKRYFLRRENVHPDWKKQLERHPKLLDNKPEEKFQLDLVRFLKNNCIDFVLKEVQNDHEERYDIWVGTDDNKIYVFEIKWLGYSITPSGNVNFKYNNKKRAIEGAYQLLDYIKSDERELKDIHLAILTIFDAREEMDDIDYPGELIKMPNLDLKQHFKIEKNKVKASQAYIQLKKHESRNK